jgi:hypothetical protein
MVKLGLQLHCLYNSYYIFWLYHYLKLNRPWVEILASIRKNPFCPVDIETTYGNILFKYTPEENNDLFNVLPWGKKLRLLYQQRIEN